MFDRPLRFLAAALAVFSGSVAFAQTLDYGQYQSMLTMKDFFQEKIVDNKLYGSIEFLDDDTRPVPTFEAYHESNSWDTGIDSVWLGNLRSGARLHLNADKIASSPLGLDIFCLMDFNFVSAPSGYAPVLDVPFPYLMDIDETAKEIMPGISVQYGDAIDPYIQLSYGHSFFNRQETSEYFDAIDPINVFDLRSPRYGLYLQVLQSGQAIDFSQDTTFSCGLTGKTPWLKDWLSDRLKVYRSLYSALRLEEIANKYAANNLGSTHFGVESLFGIADFDFAATHGEGRGIRTGWWRLGASHDFETERDYSSIYKTKMKLRGGVTYKNVMDYRGIFLLPFKNGNYSGLGCYAEVSVQNPFSQSLDIFDVLLNMNLYVLQAVSGQDGESTLDVIQAKILEIASKEQGGQYNSNFFDRITLGFELNNPDTLAIYPFTLDQAHVYCYIDAFI